MIQFNIHIRVQSNLCESVPSYPHLHFTNTRWLSSCISWAWIIIIRLSLSSLAPVGYWKRKSYIFWTAYEQTLYFQSMILGGLLQMKLFCQMKWRTEITAILLRHLSPLLYHPTLPLYCHHSECEQISLKISAQVLMLPLLNMRIAIWIQGCDTWSSLHWIVKC